MITKVTLIFVFMSVLAATAEPTQAHEPTWLFTVPKAQSMGKGYYNIGLVYADFGVTENLELGIHGVKYSLPGSDIGFGASFFPMASPYVVVSPGSDSSRIHLGLKAAPYVFFGGVETYMSRNVKFAVELNNGLSAGIRIFPAQNWTLDIFALFASVEVYRYKYRIEVEDFHLLPGILFAYSSRF